MRMDDRGVAWISAIVFGGLVAIAALALRPRMAELPYYEPETQMAFAVPFRSMAEHDAHMKGRDWPYVLELDAHSEGRNPETAAASVSATGPALLYYGSWHTRDPKDPQITEMRALWTEFRPTVAVTENRLGPYFGALGYGVGLQGEFAVAGELGRRAGLPVYTLEPSWSVEVETLKREFSVEDLIVFYTLRVYLSERDGTVPEKRDALAEHLLGKRAARDGLGPAHVPDIARFDEVWRERFPGLGEWRTLPSEALHPSDAPTRLQWIATRVNEVRDEHAAAVILDLLARGERVFAIAGGSHVVKQEPVLRAGFAALAERSALAD